MKRPRLLTAAAAALGAAALLASSFPGLEHRLAVSRGLGAAAILVAVVSLLPVRRPAGFAGALEELDRMEGVAWIGLARDGSVDSFSRGAESLLGRPASGVLGAAAATLVPPEEAGELSAEVAAATAREKAAPARRRRFVSASGAAVEALCVLGPRRDGGALLLLVASGTSGAAEERRAALFGDTPAGLLHVDAGGMVEAVSPALAAWVGRRPELLEGLRIGEAEFLPRGLRESLARLAAERGPGGTSAEEETELLGPSGGARAVWALSRSRAGGGADAVLVDAASRRRLLAERDAAREALAAARDMAAGAVEELARSERPAPAGSGEAGPGGDGASRPPRVLLVEDDDENRRLLAHMLRSRGAEVTACSRGADALEASRRERFDLGLLDVQMPDMDGYEVYRRLRALPGGRDLPLVAVTAYTSDFDKERAQVEGFNDFVPKPVSLATIESILARFAPRARA